MKTWEELGDMHRMVSQILFRETDYAKMKVQSAELDMLAFFRDHHSDQEVRLMKETLEASQSMNKLTLARISMCEWFLKGKPIEVKS